MAVTIVYSIDADLKNTFTKTHSIDADLKNIFIKISNIDTDLKKTQTKTYTVDADLDQKEFKTVNIDAFLVFRRIRTYFIDCFLRGDGKQTYYIDAKLISRSTNTKTYSIDALFKRTKMVSIDALFKGKSIRTHSINAVLVAPGLKFTSIDAIFSDGPVYYFDYADNIIYITEHTELYINDVSVKISNYNTSNTKEHVLWSVPDETILAWNFLANPIGPDDTHIETTLSNIDQIFAGTSPDLSVDRIGYLLIDHELIRYNNIVAFGIDELERGFAGTQKTSHNAGSLVGEAYYAEPIWDSGPALQIKYPFCTAIDEVTVFEGTDGQPVNNPQQAKIVTWSYDAFSGKIGVGNAVAAYTPLASTAFGTITDPLSSYKWATEVAGQIFNTPTKQQEIGNRTGRTTSTRRWTRYIKRYGKNTIVIDNPWIETANHGKEISNTLIDEFKNPRQIVNIKAMGNPALQLGDLIRVVNYPQLNIHNQDYNIISISYSYDGGLVCDILARAIKPPVANMSSLSSTKFIFVRA